MTDDLIFDMDIEFHWLFDVTEDTQLTYEQREELVDLMLNDDEYYEDELISMSDEELIRLVRLQYNFI